MILRFKHKGLETFFTTGSMRGIDAGHAKRLRMLLGILATAQEAGDMDIMGARLHPLKGKLKAYWAVSVSGNWRLIFRFDKGNATDVDLVDYH